MIDPRRTTSDPSAPRMFRRPTAGANPVPPINPAMSSRAVRNAKICCMGAVPEPNFQDSEIDKCAGPVAFQNPIAGTCDIDLKFRADVDLVERFIPRNTPAYPPMNEPICDEDANSTAFLLDKASGNISPVEYSPCFESWRRAGYQPER